MFDFNQIQIFNHFLKNLIFHIIFFSIFQQLFRSQNPSLAASNAGVPQPGQPGAQQQIQQTLPLPSQSYLAPQNAAYAAAAQQPTPYVINPGQDATQYAMGLIPAGMPQYYGVAPWGMYPANLIAQQNAQPPPQQRRPLTPSQQSGENQPPYQVLYSFNLKKKHHFFVVFVVG